MNREEIIEILYFIWAVLNTLGIAYSAWTLYRIWENIS